MSILEINIARDRRVDEPTLENEQAKQASSELQVELFSSRQMPNWMAEQRVSLAFTTYQASKIFFIGLQPDGKLSIFERTFERCMGLWGNEQTIYMSSRYQVWRFENALQPGQLHQGYDRLYVPQIAYTTGDLDIHDLCVDANNRIVFVNALFSCLATVSEVNSFTPLWQPPFITKLAAEDRCHLSGLALRDGMPRYVTAVAKSDVHEGWREHRVGGGIVMDVTNDEIIAQGLSMPHSPRFYRDKLWILNSGTGEFGFIDFASGKFQPIVFCPGYLRGLTFVNDFALIGLSTLRGSAVFGNLPIEERLKQEDTEAKCGIYVIDLRSGDIVHSIKISGIVEELYDVIALQGVFRPMALGTKTDEICRVLTLGDSGRL